MQIGDVESIIEERRLKSILEGCPVAADDAVVGDDGLEDATVVVSPEVPPKSIFIKPIP